MIELGDHKNDLAHYLPLGLSDLRQVGEQAWMASVNPPQPMDPRVRLEYAKHGVSTMLDLWFAQVWTFTGEVPDDSWKPPVSTEQ